MGTFTPSNAILGTVNEGQFFDFSIGYTDDLGIIHDVVITTDTPNSSVTVGVGRISGSYTTPFNDVIKFRTPLHGYGEEPALTLVPVSNRPLIYQMMLDQSQMKDYYYTATANGETFTYNIEVLNDWDAKRDLLKEYLQGVPPQVESIRWLNANQLEVTFVNDQGQTITWVIG